VALWHLCLNLGSATKAGEGAVSVVVTMVIIWSIFITRSWRRRDEEADRLPGQSWTSWVPVSPARARSTLSGSVMMASTPPRSR
jgi:hypothetical protein